MLGFRLPTHVQIKPGCLAELPSILGSLEIHRVLWVVDRGFLQANSARFAEIEQKVRRAGLYIEIFDRVESDPTTEIVEEMTEFIRERSLDGVIGLGGGSVMDAGKAAAMLAVNDGKAIDYEGKNRFTRQPLPFVAIPTTCGTGSEVTWVSVLTHQATQRKISVKGDGMFPDQALVDADLLQTLPADLVAWTGIDALTHVLEATTSRATNPVSDALAETVLTLLFNHLPEAVADIAQNAEAREATMRAATLAGISFGNADVGAVHCLSETLGGLYHVPHGLGNAILLIPVFEYHQSYIVPRLAALARKIWPLHHPQSPESELADYFMGQLRALSRQLDIPSFKSLSIDPQDFPKIAELSVMNGSNDSNPQPMEKDDYLAILNKIG